MEYIRSGKRDKNGKAIYSGQIVKCNGLFRPTYETKVSFNPTYGFRFGGNNYADAQNIEIIKDITKWQKFIGGIKLLVFNISSRDIE